MAISKIEAASIGYAGAVLQVINTTYSTQKSSTSTTYIDTGLTATITPKFATSKILVIVSQNGVAKDSGNSENSINLRLIRDSSTISVFGLQLAYTATAIWNVIGCQTTNYLDSPATTSAVVYKTQQARGTAAGGTAYTQLNGDISSITLLEIAG